MMRQEPSLQSAHLVVRVIVTQPGLHRRMQAHLGLPGPVMCWLCPTKIVLSICNWCGLSLNGVTVL